MGTRNLTAVMHGGEYKIAQYGQWDGYPDGQGVTALEFCRKHLADDAGRAAFADSLKRVRFVTDADRDEIEKFLASIGAKDGWLNSEQADRYKHRYPHMSRDNGAEILEMVSTATTDVIVQNSISFAGDSLFCEWAYVVDLDRETLEVYEGHSKAPTTGERFSESPRDVHPDGTVSEYHPVRHRKTWSLNALPTEDEFLGELKDEEA